MELSEHTASQLLKEDEELSDVFIEEVVEQEQRFVLQPWRTDTVEVSRYEPRPAYEDEITVETYWSLDIGLKPRTRTVYERDEQRAYA